jgi:hypothetical protein
MTEPSKPEIDQWKQCYRTPPEFFSWVSRVVLPRYGQRSFTLDTCATPWNAMCPDFIAPPGTLETPGMVGVDGLKMPWATSGAAWCNPGFKKLKLWVPCAIAQAEVGQFSAVLSHAAHACEWALMAIEGARACWKLNPRINYIEDPRYLSYIEERGKSLGGNPRDSKLWIFEPGYEGPCEFIAGKEAQWCDTTKVK